MLTLFEDLMLKFSQGVDRRVWAQPVFPAELRPPCVLLPGSLCGHVLSVPPRDMSLLALLSSLLLLWASWCSHASHCSSGNLFPSQSFNQPPSCVFDSLNHSVTSLSNLTFTTLVETIIFSHPGSYNSLPAGLSASVFRAYLIHSPLPWPVWSKM